MKSAPPPAFGDNLTDKEKVTLSQLGALTFFFVGDYSSRDNLKDVYMDLIKLEGSSRDITVKAVTPDLIIL